MRALSCGTILHKVRSSWMLRQNTKLQTLGRLQDLKHCAITSWSSSHTRTWQNSSWIIYFEVIEVCTWRCSVLSGYSYSCLLSNSFPVENEDLFLSPYRVSKLFDIAPSSVWCVAYDDLHHYCGLRIQNLHPKPLAECQALCNHLLIEFLFTNSRKNPG